MSKKTKFVIDVDANISQLQAKLSTLKTAFSAFKGTSLENSTQKQILGIEKAIERLQQKITTPITSATTFSGMNRDISAISLSMRRLFHLIEDFDDLDIQERLKLLPKDEAENIQKAIAALSSFSKAAEKATQESAELVRKQKEINQALTSASKQKGKEEDYTVQLKAAQAQLEALKKLRDAYTELARRKKIFEDAGANQTKTLITEDGEELTLAGARAAIKKAKKGTIGLGLSEVDVDKPEDVAQAYGAVAKRIQDYTSRIQDAQQKQKEFQTTLTRLNKELEELQAAGQAKTAEELQRAFQNLRKEAEKLGISLDGIGNDYTADELAKLRERFSDLVGGGITKASEAAKGIGVTLDSTTKEVDKLSEGVERGREAWKQYDEQTRNTNAMINRIKHFVGLSGAATLARRAIQNAMRTIKELDKTMTEMSVVTDLGVGDYWKQLPEYTDRANELGVAVKDAYESATLYYQQGLKTEEVIALSTETLKMARVAGLDAADATNKMTAALRGFNLELNQTNAQRVSDVYSELAAITASDVNEISSAMTKTASIASNAGMALETTAAFLSQIIETTRESAETAGTALTISA